MPYLYTCMFPFASTTKSIEHLSINSDGLSSSQIPFLIPKSRFVDAKIFPSFRCNIQYFLSNIQGIFPYYVDIWYAKRNCLCFVQIRSPDSLEIKERTLKITPTEREKLGINKSTLWYQKNNLAAGKRIKLYGKVLSKLV